MFEAILEHIQYQIQTNGFNILKTITFAVMAFLLIYFISVRIINHIKNKIISNNLEYNNEQINKIARLIGSMLFILFMLFNVLIFFEILWINTALLIWGLSLWLAFSMENVIGNMISWVMILTNKKLKIWDFLQFDWQLNTVATVENIHIRYTVLRTINNRRLLIPNTMMLATPFKTLKIHDVIRCDIWITVPRWANISQVKKLIKQELEQKDNIIKKEFISSMISWFSARWIDIKTFFYIDPKVSSAGYFVKVDAIQKIATVLKKYWIIIPVNTVTLDTE